LRMVWVERRYVFAPVGSGMERILDPSALCKPHDDWSRREVGVKVLSSALRSLIGIRAPGVGCCRVWCAAHEGVVTAFNTSSSPE